MSAESAETAIINRLRAQTIGLYMTLGMTEAEAEGIFHGLVARAKEASQKKGLADINAASFFSLAETNARIRAELQWKANEGVREEDLQWWWNMHDFERQMILASDEAMILGYYEALRKQGTNKEEAMRELRITHATFAEFSPPEEAQGRHSGLPVELKARVTAYQDKQNAYNETAAKWQESRRDAGSANAAIRSLIERGEI
jgi:hypothetical protein